MAIRRSEGLLASGEKEEEQEQQEQRAPYVINDLPDPILCHILSFLPANNAVATTILSKRWKFLWTKATHLDFHYWCPKYYPPGYSSSPKDIFVDFVNYVLLLHKPGCLNKLSLNWDYGCIPVYVNIWITAALLSVSGGVDELFVNVDINELPIHVQKYMFNSETLKSLELHARICISPDFEIVFSLPRLERLKLISVYFQTEESFRKLLDGCPVLNYLVIHMDIGKMSYFEMLDKGEVFKCIISSASLRHLELVIYAKDPSYKSFCSVQLDTPSLEYIKLQGYINSIVLPERLNLLDEANMQHTPFEAIEAFGCAKKLNLSNKVMGGQTWFNRLTRLEVLINWNYWSSLQDLIEMLDNLQVLIVNKVKVKVKRCDYDIIDPNNFNWKKPNLVPRCLLNSLKKVSIGAYDDYPDEHAMVDYILTHGSVLEIMQICFGETIKYFQTKYELVQHISFIPRKSTTCKFKFRDCYDYDQDIKRDKRLHDCYDYDQDINDYNFYDQDQDINDVNQDINDYDQDINHYDQDND